MAVNPAEIEAVFQVAVAHHSAGRLAEAEPRYRQILAQSPRHARAMHLLGVLAKQAGKSEDGARLIGQAIEIDPNQADFHSNYGNVLTACGRREEAVAACRRAVAMNPQLVYGFINLSLALWELKRYDESLAACLEALRLQPTAPEAHNNLGLTYRETGRMAEALASFEKAIQYRPDFAEAYGNLAESLWFAGRFYEAVDVAAKAVTLNPDRAESHWTLALSRLLIGDLPRGFAEYEWRWRQASFYKLTPPLTFTKPAWDGTDLTGRTIVLHAEQGFGDAIQFARYAALVKQRWNPQRIVLQCHAELVRLLAVSGVADEVVSRDGPVPDYEVHFPLMSLPNLLGTTLDNVPAGGPYLRPDPEQAVRWRDILDADAAGRLRVGLCWAGRSTHANDAHRSMRLAALAPLAGVAGVRFYSLQKGATEAQLAGKPEGLEWMDYSDQWQDFADTAAFVANLDLVITIDSSPAHLAAAMGVPTWVLLPRAPDWRWLLGRGESPWYPSMRLFRQKASSDWTSAIDTLVDALRRTVESRR